MRLQHFTLCSTGQKWGNILFRQVLHSINMVMLLRSEGLMGRILFHICSAVWHDSLYGVRF